MTREVNVRNAILYGHPFLLFDNGDMYYVGLSMAFFFQRYSYYYHRAAWN